MLNKKQLKEQGFTPKLIEQLGEPDEVKAWHIYGGGSGEHHFFSESRVAAFKRRKEVAAILNGQLSRKEVAAKRDDATRRKWSERLEYLKPKIEAWEIIVRDFDLENVSREARQVFRHALMHGKYLTDGMIASVIRHNYTNYERLAERHEYALDGLAGANLQGAMRFNEAVRGLIRDKCSEAAHDALAKKQGETE